MSAVLTTNRIYDQLYTDKTENAFLHSHTYTGNALGAAVALETLNIFEDDNIVENSQKMSTMMLHHIHQLQNEFGFIENIRAIGAIAAFNIELSKYTSDFKIKILQAGQRVGVHLRPLGRTLYWVPPLIATEADLADLAEATRKCLTVI